MDKSLKQLLLDKINSSGNWITKGVIYDLCEAEGYSPETGARICRELAEQGKILVSYYKSKKNKDLARYARLNTQKPIPQKPVLKEIERDGQRIMVYA